MQNDVIYSINGPVVTVKNSKTFKMMDMVYVGKEKLIGEVISVSDEKTVIQVYEDTAGLCVGEPVVSSNGPLCAVLGPGLMKGIFDGIERPLEILAKQSGKFIAKGISCDNLDTQKLWDTTLLVKVGDYLKGGDIFATVPETNAILHKSMVPPYMKGKVTYVAPNGLYNINDVILKLDDNKTVYEISLCQKWPIKTARPYISRHQTNTPLLTGQRIIDTMFPVAKGGAAAIPGGFGTGKTMTQHQIAKWSDADIIIYIGCGERGNEMTQVLEEFGELIDPRTNKALTDRTILIANTSNMPVAAREASIYTGITLAEYYRDMGYNIAIMADSTSRWAEALREISGRLEEMPAEEGFPAYLPSKLSQFYERAGFVKNLNNTDGSVTIIGAVSPQGGDFSEPVTQNTKRFIRCFWALDKNLAYSRHYPAVNWVTSYTEYYDDLKNWYNTNVNANFDNYRLRILNLLYEEDKLMEIIKLIGSDVLPEDQKLVLSVAKLIRVGFLQQNSFNAIDTYVPIEKQFKMMETILFFYDSCLPIIKQSIPVSKINELDIYEQLSKMKFEIKNDDLSAFDEIKIKITNALNDLNKQYE